MDLHKEDLTIPETPHTNVEPAGESSSPNVSQELEDAGVHSEKGEHFDRIADELQRSNSVELPHNPNQPHENALNSALTPERQEEPAVIVDTPTLEFTHKQTVFQHFLSPIKNVFGAFANFFRSLHDQPLVGSANNGDSSVEEVNRIRQQHAHGNI